MEIHCLWLWFICENWMRIRIHIHVFADLMNILPIYEFRRNKSLIEFRSEKLYICFCHFSNSIILSIYMQSTLLAVPLIALMEFMMCKSCLCYLIVICGCVFSLLAGWESEPTSKICVNDYLMQILLYSISISKFVHFSFFFNEWIICTVLHIYCFAGLLEEIHACHYMFLAALALSE